jgi:hypothetical protein
MGGSTSGIDVFAEGGVGGDADQVNPAVVVPDDEQDIEPAKDGVDMEEVDCGDRVGLAERNCFQPAAVCCGAGSIPADFRIAQMVEGAILHPRPVSSLQIRR